MQLEDRALSWVLAKVHPWPHTKGLLVEYVRANEQHSPLGTVLSLRAIDDETGIHRGLAHRYLRELVDDRVLLRHDGGGPRGHAYRVNRAFDEWRVPWLGARPGIDRAAWAARRDKALAQIALFLCPPEGQKPRTVARPDARLTGTVARAVAPLWDPSRAMHRATTAPLAARPDARLGNGARPAHTIPSELEDQLIDRTTITNEPNPVLGLVVQRSGGFLAGEPKRRAIAAVDGHPPGPFVAALETMPAGLNPFVYVETLEHVAASLALPPAAPARPAEPALEPLGPGTAPPWKSAGMTRDEWFRTCETAAGGAR